MIRVGQPEIDAMARVIASGALFRYNWSDEPTEVDLFEQEWAAKMGTTYALAVTGGTAALICACAGLGIGPGDEVIVPGYTFIATPVAPLVCGAIPVIADIDDSLLLDPDDIERHISPRTKAIIPVHMQGLPCDMDRIMAIARRRNLYVIEDACQADAGCYKGRRLGSIGDAGAFSFNFFKIVTCGEGGAMVTNDRKVFEGAQMMHDSGLTFFGPERVQQDTPIFVGLGFRLNNILAAMLRAQMTQVDGWLEAMRAIKGRMMAELADAKLRIVPSNDISGDCGVVFGFQLATEEETLRCQASLAERGIGAWRPFDTGRHIYCNWEPILQHRAFHCEAMNPFAHPANQGANMSYTPDMLPRTLEILKRTLLVSLTLFWTEEEVGRTIEGIRAVTASLTAA